jgi:hypothetical protein
MPADTNPLGVRDGCRNPSRPSICLCPVAGRGYGPRQVLASTFINSWLGEGIRLNPRS